MRTSFSRRESFQAMLAALLMPLYGWRQGPRPHQEGADGKQNSPATPPRAAMQFPVTTTYLYDDRGRLLSVISPESHGGTSWTY